jgi:ribosomal protein S26
MSCPATYEQIDNDLAKFKEIDLQKVAKEAVERFGQHHALVHYSIIKNKVCYLSCIFCAIHQRLISFNRSLNISTKGNGSS